MKKISNKTFLQSPFGLLSGTSTSIAFAIFLTILFTISSFFQLKLSLEKLTLGYLIFYYFDGELFLLLLKNHLASPFGGQVFRSQVSLKPSLGSNLLIGILYLLVDGFAEGLLVYQAYNYGIEIPTIFLALCTGKIIVGPLLGKISDIIRLKKSLLITNTISIAILATLYSPDHFGLSISSQLFCMLLFIKGAFASGFVVFKPILAMSCEVSINELVKKS